VPRFSAFNSTHFTSRSPYTEQVYVEMTKALGSGKNYTTEFDSLVGARLYANAMALGRCKYAIERSGQQFRCDTALESLPKLEREYGLIPERGATIAQRRAKLVVAARIARGASRSNVEFVLTELFGSDFIAYLTVAVPDMVVSPALPATTGVYEKPGSLRGAFETLDSVTTNGSPVTIRCSLIAGAQETLRVGGRFVIDPGSYSRVEAVAPTQIVHVGTVVNVTAIFTKPHDRGVFVATGRHANQATSKRHNTFWMSPTAAVDAKVRKRVHRAARRLLRGISTWSVADDSGPFQVGVGRLGVTPIGALPGDDTFE